MLDSGQNWELFGYDMRHLGRHWLAAWRDLLWGYDSPVRRHLDEVVTVRSEQEDACYQAGLACAVSPTSGCEAILLPDELALSKTLRLPVSVESELDSVLAIEVRASSPFAASDTGWGWNVVARDEVHLHVALAMVSMSATMAYLGRQYDSHDSRAQEIWTRVDGVMVVVRGFGEQARESRYRQRLLRSGAMLCGAAVLLLVIFAVSAGLKSAELQRLETMAAATTRDATEASRLKTVLAGAHETIAAANDVVARFPNPHLEIARLTHLLGDDASIANFAMSGASIRLRGRAADAASVMEQLTEEPAYSEVRSPQAIVRLGDTGLEQFYLDIRVAGEAPQ